jgi:hypothetical protein
VDRNCDAKEEEIDTQIPIPLYLGLMGTMAGILVGILYLWLSDGLNNLLNNTLSDTGAEGVEALLGGVALAMIASILGIILTTTGSTKHKNSKVEVESNKNGFISWIQSELLPKMSNDMPDVLDKMTRNLATFNRTFSENTKELKGTLSQVNESYQLQAEIMKAVNKLKIAEIATANIAVYDKLKNCTEEIGYFSTYLHSVNEYVANVKALNEKLDANETRMKAIEDMGIFFKQEKEIFEARKGFIYKAVGEVDATLQNALSKLKDNTDNQFIELTKATVKQQDVLQQALQKGLEEASAQEKEVFEIRQGLVKKAVDGVDTALQDALARLKENTDKQISELTTATAKQQQIFQERLGETPAIVAELKNLTAVKDTMSNLEKATWEQNQKLDNLTEAILKLAKTRTRISGTSPSVTKCNLFKKWLKRR